jgi:hypothetical protein
VIVVARRGAGDGKRAKAVFALELFRGAIERLAIEPPDERKLVTSAKGRSRFVACPDVVAVSASSRAVSGVKLGAHFDGAVDPHVGWKEGVECAAELLYVPAVGNSYADGLSTGMHSGVGSP